MPTYDDLAAQFEKQWQEAEAFDNWMPDPGTYSCSLSRIDKKVTQKTMSMGEGQAKEVPVPTLIVDFTVLDGPEGVEGRSFNGFFITPQNYGVLKTLMKTLGAPGGLSLLDSEKYLRGLMNTHYFVVDVVETYSKKYDRTFLNAKVRSSHPISAPEVEEAPTEENHEATEGETE